MAPASAYTSTCAKSSAVKTELLDVSGMSSGKASSSSSRGATADRSGDRSGDSESCEEGSSSPSTAGVFGGVLEPPRIAPPVADTHKQQNDNDNEYQYVQYCTVQYREKEDPKSTVYYTVTPVSLSYLQTVMYPDYILKGSLKNS